MPSRLVNVRLDPERVRRVRALRERGVSVSVLVREAIDERFERVIARGAPRDVSGMVRDLFERFPDPPDLGPRGYDVHDRRQARDAIRRRLRPDRRDSR